MLVALKLPVLKTKKSNLFLWPKWWEYFLNRLFYKHQTKANTCTHLNVSTSLTQTHTHRNIVCNYWAIILKQPFSCHDGTTQKKSRREDQLKTCPVGFRKLIFFIFLFALTTSQPKNVNPKWLKFLPPPSWDVSHKWVEISNF